MVNLTTDQFNSQMNKRDNIRNISIISSVNHGKSNIVKNLINRSGINIFNTAIDRDYNNNNTTTTTEIESEFKKSRLIQLFYENNENNDSYLINLMETSCLLEQDTASAFRITDSVILLVDAIEQVYPEKLLKTAVVNELLKPILFLNKVDRFFLELKINNHEEIYQSLNKTIENINSKTLSLFTSSYNSDTTNSSNEEDILFTPIKNNVIFGSGLYDWSFTLEKFAKFYSNKFAIPINSLIKRLWGDNFFDPVQKKWVNYSVLFDDENKTRPPLKRGFCQFILEPIEKLTQIIMEGGNGSADSNEPLNQILKSLNIKLDENELKLNGKQLLKVVMKNWLPLSSNLLSTCVNQLPSPIDAQKFRIANLYEGPMDDDVSNSIRNCDPNGPLMIFISKLIPLPNSIDQFYGIGRIFSGKVKNKDQVKFMNGDDEKGVISCIKEINLITNSNLLERLDNDTVVSCGNIIGFNFIDNFITSSGTISSPQVNNRIRNLKRCLSTIVNVPISPVEPEDIHKLVKSLKNFERVNLDIIRTNLETGEIILSGPTKSYIDSCLDQLSQNYLDSNNIRLNISESFLSYRESITVESSTTCIAKSPNKANRIFVKAEPLSISLQDELENGLLETSCSIEEKGEEGIILKEKFKNRTNHLIGNYGWTKNDAMKIWAFGPQSIHTGNNTNCLVDQTKVVLHIDDIKSRIVSVFNWVSREGPLCDEPMKGVKFNLTDVVMAPSSVVRGIGQLLPTSRRAMYSSFLTASPTLLEPWYQVEINVLKESLVSEIFLIVNQRRGIIYSSDERILSISSNNSIFNLKAHIPVSEFNEFERELNFKTFGLASLINCSFDHWSSLGGILNYNIPSGSNLNSNIYLENDKKLTEIIFEIRKRKGLKIELPQLELYLDTM